MSRIFTGSPILRTKISPPSDIAPAWITNSDASSDVIKYLLASGSVTVTGPPFFICFSNKGMTEPEEVDISIDKISANKLFDELPDWCQANIEEVSKNIGLIDYPENKSHLIPGKVEHTVPENQHERIALLRLDTDWYESTRIELEYLFPKLVKGGILIIDDYGHWEGARKATDEYFEKNNIQIFLNRVDYTCRLGVKS